MLKGWIIYTIIHTYAHIVNIQPLKIIMVQEKSVMAVVMKVWFEQTKEPTKTTKTTLSMVLRWYDISLRLLLSKHVGGNLDHCATMRASIFAGNIPQECFLPAGTFFSGNIPQS